MRKRASVSSVCEVNPRIPTQLREQTTLPVSFLPMASVLESGTIIDVSERELGDVQTGYRYFEEGDVLVAKITPCMENGKAALAVELPHRVGFGSTEFHVLRPGDDVDGRYLFHMVWNPMFRHAAEKRMTGSAGQRRVPSSFFEQFKIPLPPLPEQQRIAAILDKADAVRRKRQQTLDLADQFLRSAFLDLFGDPVTNPKGWPVEKLGDCFAEKPRIGSIAKAEDDGEYRVVRVGDLGQMWLPASLQTRVNLAPKDIERFRIEPGDFLLARAIGSEEHLGKASIVAKRRHRSEEAEVFDSHVMRLRFTESAVRTEFFWQWLKSRGGRTLFMRNAGRTAVQFNINATQITRISIPVPPVELQERFVQISVGLRSMCGAADRAVDQLVTLHGSLTQRAFRGELGAPVGGTL